MKVCIVLAVFVFSVSEGWAQTLRSTDRLPTGRTYVGDNELHVDVTTAQRAYTYLFPNMAARLDRRLKQIILAIPRIEPDLADLTVLNTMTPAEREFLTRLVHVDRENPIIVRFFFPLGVIDLEQLEDAPLTMTSEVQMGGVTYKAPAQVQGLYRDDQLLISFSLVIDNTVVGIPQQSIEDLQLYAQGVRLAGVPGYSR